MRLSGYCCKIPADWCDPSRCLPHIRTVFRLGAAGYLEPIGARVLCAVSTPPSDLPPCITTIAVDVTRPTTVLDKQSMTENASAIHQCRSGADVDSARDLEIVRFFAERF